MRDYFVIIVVLLTLLVPGCGEDRLTQTKPGGGSPPAVSGVWKSANGPMGWGGAVAFTASGEVLVPGFGVMFRSSDRGDTWATMGQLPMDPDGDYPVGVAEMVVTGAGLLVAVTESGIIRSANQGRSWAFFQTPGVMARVVASPTGDLFAAGWGLYASKDGGATWDRAIDTWIYELAADSHGTVFAGRGPLLYRSTDGAATWKVDTLSIDVGAIVVDTTDRVYIGGRSRVLVSADSGESWDEYDVVPGAQYRIAALAADSLGNVLASTITYDATPPGVYRSSDQGRTWVPDGGPVGDEEVAWQLDIAPDNTAFAKTEEAVYRSDGAGETWKLVGVPTSSIGDVFVTKSGRVFAGTTDSYLLETGKLFQLKPSGDGWDYLESWDGTALAFAENSMGHLFVATTSGLMVSMDGGATWAHGTFTLSMTSILVDPDDDARMWAGTSQVGAPAGMYFSPDGGTNWSPVSEVVTAVYDMESLGTSGPIAATEAGVVGPAGPALEGIPVGTLALLGSTIFAGTEAGIYSSEDGGATFEATDTPAGLVITLETHSSGILYASMLTDETLFSGAVYRSTDEGSSWQRYDSGLMGLLAYSLYQDPGGDMLMGTWRLGVMRAKP